MVNQNTWKSQWVQAIHHIDLLHIYYLYRIIHKGQFCFYLFCFVDILFIFVASTITKLDIFSSLLWIKI